MKTIDLEEIILKWSSKNLQENGRSKKASESVVKNSIKGGHYWYILEAMKEACKQTLELAAENAVELIDETNGCRECGVNGVNKQSILDTINQIKYYANS